MQDRHELARVEATLMHDDIELLMPGSRVGDAGRERAAQHITQMMSEGYITQEEADRRVSHALAATTHRELDGLMSDLPAKPLTHMEAFRLAKAKREPMTRMQVRIVRSWVMQLVFMAVFAALGSLMWGGVHTSHGAAAITLTFGSVVTVIWTIVNAAWTTEDWNR